MGGYTTYTPNVLYTVVSATDRLRPVRRKTTETYRLRQVGRRRTSCRSTCTTHHSPHLRYPLLPPARAHCSTTPPTTRHAAFARWRTPPPPLALCDAVYSTCPSVRIAITHHPQSRYSCVRISLSSTQLTTGGWGFSPSERPWPYLACSEERRLSPQHSQRRA